MKIKRQHTKCSGYANLAKLLSVLLFTLLFNSVVFCQSPASGEANTKAAFLFNFTQFVEWPAASFSSAEAPFIIGIWGADPFGKEIDALAEGQKVNTHPLVVQRYSDSAEVKNCQILYISTREPERIKELLAKLPDHNMLTVSDTYNFARSGGMIRFYQQENKIKIQINYDAAKAANLTISSKLLRLADIVK